MFGFSSVFHSTTAGGGGGGVGPTFKIFYKADENLCLTVRDGDAVLAPADSSDEYQHWFKDNRFGTYVHDEERKPAFSLINKATDLAVQPSGGPFRPVKLVRYDWDFFDNTLMWTLSNDLGNDFGFIRTLNDISLKLAAFPDDHGGVTVKLSDLSDGDNHLWKILPWSDNIMPGRAMRLYCKAGEGFSATVRNGTVCLAPTNPHDELQYWVEDMRYRDIIKDEDGYPAFALINRATGYAIKRCEDKEGPVKLVPYDQHHLDLSVLWSKSDDMMHDFHYIRTIDYVYLNLDIYDKGDDDKMHSGVQDGAKVMLSYWRSNDDRQYWRVDPWEPEREHKTSCGITYSRRRLKKRATA